MLMIWTKKQAKRKQLDATKSDFFTQSGDVENIIAQL